jgi:methylated-DNA-[protein]-cysteine S-methyltransferase
VRTQTVLATPIGGLGVTVADGVVVGVAFGATGPPAEDPMDPALAAALAELGEYFAGSRTRFTVPVRFVRGSAFERAVWERIATIPYGQLVTYGEIARDVGGPAGAQAVGAACGRNPIPVIVPCHRVVGAGGALGGFGGGLPRKRRLLQLEAKVAIECGLDLDPQASITPPVGP